MIVMTYPLQPISREQAIASWRKSSARAKKLFLLTAFGAIAVAVAIGFLFSDAAGAPAWIALSVGGVAAAGGAAGLFSAMRQVRYRITVFLSGLRLLLIIAVAVGAIWAAGSAHLLSGRGARIFIIAVAMGALTFHLSTSTLFIGDCNGLTFRKTLVHWDCVSQVVITAGIKPSTLEIGARSFYGVKLDPIPVREGQVLTDLPCRIVVPRSKFDIERMVWVLNQSGRQDITLIERTADGDKVLASAGPVVR
ncbi:hypothetical protein MKUB_49910 [Mycobacterium kubicae]|uniref:Uncharacterized protein n=2 Tax=Mycobacterium kubicae TaxID=120959 RepID=A0ABQ1BUZ6_9MYCO|nr:hypothetical protein AWC13_15555 [Mycobacterium kubicae]GFG67501.1 hypothetical protein MKUB_49910 [Mycobacterium kubicae]